MSDWLHSPHVGTSGQLKGRHNLGFDCALQNTQSSVLAVPAQHCQLKVGLSLVDELCEIRYTEHECHASTSTSPPTHSEADHSKSQAFSDVKHYENNVHAATQLYNDRVLVIPWSHRFVLQLVLSSDCTVVTTITMIRATKRPGLIFSPTSCPLATSCMSTQRHAWAHNVMDTSSERKAGSPSSADPQGPMFSKLSQTYCRRNVHWQLLYFTDPTDGGSRGFFNQTNRPHALNLIYSVSLVASHSAHFLLLGRVQREGIKALTQEWRKIAVTYSRL